MSASALLLATRDHLRTQLGKPDFAVEVCFDGRPHPWAGKTFFAIHHGGWRNQWVEGAFDELHSVQITITQRIANVPFSKIGREVLTKEQEGLLALAEQVRLKVHLNYELMALANDIIRDGVDANGFRVPLLFQSASAPQAKGPDWFQGRAEGKQKVTESGMAMVLSFGEAERLQRYEEAT